VTAAAGALLQLISVLPLAAIAVRIRSPLAKLYGGWAGKFFALSFFALFLKVTMEIGAAMPGLSQMAYSRPVVIGYLHLTLLGFVSFLLLSHYIQSGWLKDGQKTERAGYVLLFVGFVVTELVLFLQGLFDWTQAGGILYEKEWLWMASVGMAAGIFMFARRRFWFRNLNGGEYHG
jgi:phosphotransferase system  glucose/maltose/N-acetylglucosamine-specific IIC component